MRPLHLLLVVVAGLAVFPGCGKPKGYDAKVDGIVLAQADGVIDAEPGPTLRLPGDDQAKLPDGPVVRLAIARKVPWGEVHQMLERIEAAGKKPVLLVGKRFHVKAFVLSQKLKGKESIALTATPDFKACVSPPGVDEAKCVQAVDKSYIDIAHTRTLVREAVKGYHLTDVNVEIAPNLPWADVVRTIDGARTAVRGTEIRVELRPWTPPKGTTITEPLGQPDEQH